MKRSKARFSSGRRKREVINLAGLNNSANHKPNELVSMLRMSSDKYPYLTPTYRTLEIEDLYSDSQYLFASDKLVWVKNENVYYDYDLIGSLINPPTCIVEMNDFLVFFPDEKYYDKINDSWGSFNSGYDIEQATVNDNRMFAISGNKILASKQGDFKVWDSFQGVSTDSFAADVATKGDFNGLITFQDHVTMFKDNNIHELYGNMPSNYTIPEALKIGCPYPKSAAVLNGKLYFVNEDGVYRYGGGIPRKISNNLEMYYDDAVGVAYNNKYYVSIKYGSQWQIYVYDERYNQWYGDEDEGVKNFATLDGELYALFDNHEIHQMSYTGSSKGSWSFKTNKFDQTLIQNKNYRELIINVEYMNGSFYVNINKDNNFSEQVADLTEYGYGARYFRIPINLRNCNSFQIEINGNGHCTIKNIEIVYDVSGRISTQPAASGPY